MVVIAFINIILRVQSDSRAVGTNINDFRTKACLPLFTTAKEQIVRYQIKQ